MDISLSYSGIVCRETSVATKRHKRDMSLEHWNDVNCGIEAHFYGAMKLSENTALLYRMGRWEPEDDREEDGEEEDSKSGIEE
ncbi:Ff.00g113030.m01.CDS01 [Fusarium sp. VM40]|nr:Ff.00g113030.m01.CDS01 [Fusarium sp. VM40]